MPPNSAHNTEGETPREERLEEAQRFARLRALVYNPSLRHRLILVLDVIALVIVSALAFMAYTVRSVAFDLSTSLGFQQLGGGLFLDLMILVSLPGLLPWSLLLVAAGVVLIGVLLGWREGGYFLLVTALQGLVNTLLKNAIGRARPTADVVEVFLPASGFSFPSGHVMFYTGFFGFLFFLAWTRFPRSAWRTLVLIFAGGMVLLVGPSRVYLGAHWFSDVVAAYLISLILLSVAIEFYLHALAPPSEEVQGGLIGEHDRAVPR